MDKKKGRQAKLLRFSSKQSKSRDKALTKKAKEEPFNIPLPSNLLTRKGIVTKNSLNKGTFQKNLIAFFAPYLLPEAMNGLMRAMKDNNIQAIRTTLEQYGILVPHKGNTTVFAPNFTNTNLNRAEAVAQAAAEAQSKKVQGPLDFEHVLRILEEDRPGIAARNMETLATPEGAAGE